MHVVINHHLLARQPIAAIVILRNFLSSIETKNNKFYTPIHTFWKGNIGMKSLIPDT